MSLRSSRQQVAAGAAAAVPGIVWPPIPAARDRAHLEVLRCLEQTQWWEPARISAAQFRQLAVLLEHAFRTVPFYRHRIREAGVDPRQPLTAEAWRRIPVLTRRNVQEEQLASRACPPGHGRRSWLQSSGSTGEPVKVSATELNRFLWEVFTLRDHAWHGRDFSARLLSIRAPSGAAEPKVFRSWGAPVNRYHRTGAGASLALNVDVSRQARWLVEFDPHYLLTYPSNLLALVEYCEEQGWRIPSLREVRTVSETVGDHLRQVCRAAWNVPLVDMYSSQEIGYIALQCPTHPGYHTQDEGVLVEVLDDEGQPCRPGGIGRVVVTSLHNFSMPLIRYELRDRAQAGAPCPCGRGLGTLARLMGRERNMLRLPGGEKRWPMTGFRQYAQIAPAIRQFQCVQRSLELLEVRLVVSAPLSQQEQSALADHIRKSLGHPFEIAFRFMERLERSPSGKFEEFISEVA